MKIGLARTQHKFVHIVDPDDQYWPHELRCSDCGLFVVLSELEYSEMAIEERHLDLQKIKWLLNSCAENIVDNVI